MKRQVTLKDIAKKLNVAVSTVSRALNDSYEIGPALKAKIVAYANKVAYIPNVNAQNLKNGHTDLIVVIVPFISSSFFLDFYEELVTYNKENNYDVILLQSFNNVEKEAEALRFVLKHKATALIICPVNDNSNLQILKNIQNNLGPVMIFDRVGHKLETDKIGVDNCKEIHLLGTEIAKLGAQSILLLCCENIGENASRIKGYKKALKRENLDFDPNKVLTIHYESPRDEIARKIEQKIDELIHQGIRFDAVISTTDSLSLAMLGIMHWRKLAVLHYGFCNSPQAYHFLPQLRAVSLPARQMARHVWKRLDERLDGDSSKLSFKTKLFACVPVINYST